MPKFSIPKICKTQRLWFVFFRYDKKLFRYRLNLNEIEDLEEKTMEFDILKDAIHDQLKRGWNPNVKEIAETKTNYTIAAALDFAIEKKRPNIAKKTASGYEGTIKFVKKAVKALRLNDLPITEVKRVHIKTIMEKAQEQRNWSNNAYNKHLNQLKAVLSELIQYDIIEVNPAHNIKNLRVEESIAHIPATDEQMKLIKKELLHNHYNFYIYILIIYNLGIRPTEILSIKLSMIDMDNDLIVLPPNITKGRKKYRTLPITSQLKQFLESLNFNSLPKDYYLFGSFRQQGKGNVGASVDFIPAPTQLKRDTATKRWEKIVKIGLGINVTMYSMKKYGANKKAEAGISIDAIQGTFGHSKKETTLIYLTKQNEINRKEIMDKSPEL